MNLNTFIQHHRKAVLLISLSLCIIGAYFTSHLPVAIFPDLFVPRIIITADSGDTPVPTMLANVTRPLENAVSGVPGLTKVLTTTQQGSTELDVNFSWNTDMAAALQRVQSDLAQAQPLMPSGTNISAERLNPSIFPVMGYSLYSSSVDSVVLRRVAFYQIRTRLLSVPGVQQVTVQGGDVPDYTVDVNPAALLSRGVTIGQVEDALARTNEVSSVGFYDRSYLRYNIMVSGLLKSADDVAHVTVSVKNRIPVAVGDVATVGQGVERRSGANSGDGHDAVLINIIKQPEGNTVAVADGVHAALKELIPTLPRGITYSCFYDQSQIVRESQASVTEAIVVGAVLALIVLVAFLGNARAAALVLIILPLTVLITFAAMRLLDQTINIMTLGAIAIALGLVIDDGIVVAENIFHEIESGKSRDDAISEGLHSITPAMIGSTLTTVAAFIPLTFLTGVTGQFFGPLAKVMISALLISLVLSLVLLPLLAAYIMPLRVVSKKVDDGIPSGWFGALDRLYGRALTWSLGRTRIIITVLIPLALGVGWLFTHLQTGFFPEFDEGGFILDYKTPDGTSLEETNRACKQVEEILAHTPEIAAWSRRTGTQLGFDITPLNQGDFSVRLSPAPRRDVTEIIDGLRDKIETRVPSMQVDFSQILQDNVGDIAGSPQPIEVKIFGEDESTLERLAHDVDGAVMSVPGVVDDSDGIVGSGPEVDINVDTAKAQRFGLTTDDITQAANAAIQGVEPTAIQSGSETYGVRVELQRIGTTIDPNYLPDVPVASPVTGGMVPLSSLANLTIRPGTPQITRENQRQMVVVTAGLSGRDLGSAVRDIRSKVAREVTLPEGYTIEYGGLYQSQQESFGQLALVLLTAVLLVFTLLIIQLKSIRQSFALFLAAILSLSGVVIGLTITGVPLNISSFTGAILIVGIVTENGIVLFDYFNYLRRTDRVMVPTELMVEAGKKRLRPILMTTAGAILALLPLALGVGAGAAMQRPLAIAVIGGLTISTVFTLIVAPVLYIMMLGRRDRPA